MSVDAVGDNILGTELLWYVRQRRRVYVRSD